MRGIPGSGKSTKAKSLVGEGIIHSTDDVITSQGITMIFQFYGGIQRFYPIKLCSFNKSKECYSFYGIWLKGARKTHKDTDNFVTVGR
jgi:hypothetical protein